MDSARSGANNVYKVKRTGMAYLQFLYYDPVSNKNKPFPKGTPVKVQFIDDADAEKSKQTKIISNSEGKITYVISSDVDVNLRFSIDSTIDRYINVTKGKLMTKDSLDEAIKEDELYLTKEMVFLLPKSITLQNSVWEVGKMPTGNEAPTYDKVNFRFQGLNKIKTLEGVGDFLKIILKPEWQYVKFKYYDKYNKAEASVPQFIMLEGHIDGNIIARSNLYKGKCICLPWIEKDKQKSTRDATKTILKFGTADTFFVNAGILTNNIVQEDMANVRKKSLSDRLKYYDIPKIWLSKDWLVKIGNETKKFSDMVNKDTTLVQPLEFDLDSIVFTGADLKCKDWDITHRFTVFDPKIAIAKADPDKPYLTKTDALKDNMLTRAETGNEVRLIALNSVFYDVTDKRSDTGAIDVIGARAAVENAPDVHHFHIENIPRFTEYELHYLTDCLDPGGNLSSVLLIYFSCKYIADGTTQQADIDNFNKLGITNAKARWEKKGYLFKSGKITVRPVFFFESRETDPKKAEIKISNIVRSHHKNYTKNAYQEQPCIMQDFDVDFRIFARFTMAHELGHSLGLYDEYLEAIEIGGKGQWNPILPRFDQVNYKGGYYFFDNISIMCDNMAPRLRHFWFFCRWLNDEADVQKIVKAKNNIANNVAFKIVYDRLKSEYSLPPAYNNYYNPARKEDNKANGNPGDDRRLSLYLYKIGNDETDKMMITGMKGFDSILYVRLEVFLDFVAYTDNGNPTHNHTWANEDEKGRYIAFFHNVTARFNGKYYIETENDGDFKKTYVYFVPHYGIIFSGNTAGIKTNPVFQVYIMAHNTVKGNPDIIFAPDFFKDNFKHNSFSVDRTHNIINIFRYLLGLPTYESQPAKGDFTINNMSQHVLDILDSKRISYMLFDKFVKKNALHNIPAPDVTVVDAGCKWTITDKKTDGEIYQEIKYSVERTESKISVSGRAAFTLDAVKQIDVNSLNGGTITQAIKDLFKAKLNELENPAVTQQPNNKWKITDTRSTGNVEYNLEVQEIKLDVTRQSIKKAINTIKVDDLKFLADWVEAQLGGAAKCTIKSK